MGVREEDLGDLLVAGRLGELGHWLGAVLGERHLFVYSDDSWSMRFWITCMSDLSLLVQESKMTLP